jgi:hypothetical protein
MDRWHGFTVLEVFIGVVTGSSVRAITAIAC